MTVACGGRGPGAAPDILLVVLDTVRADHLSSYGYARPTTPHLDRLADEGQRYTRAFAQSPWTLPAVASILTGQPPHVHGADLTSSGVFGVSPSVSTLAEQLSDAGYRSAAFMNVLWLGAELSSLDRGFEHYDVSDTDETNRGHRDARATTDAAIDWLGSIDRDPFFLVVHYFDPHLTYDPPTPFDTMFEPDEGPRIRRGFGSTAEAFGLRSGRIELEPRARESLIARYDGELRFVDEQFGRLRAALEERGRFDDTVVVVVGDHGEEFWDHGGFEHGHSHHAEVLRIPLIVRGPGGPAGSVHTGLARQIDVAPTLLHLAGLVVPEALPGRVLDASGAPYAIAEGSLWSGELRSVRSERGTLLLEADGVESRFFEAADTAEERPVDGGKAEGALAALLRELPEAERDRPVVPFGEKALARLRALGYLQ